MKWTVSAVWAAVVQAALRFVPIPARWVVRLVQDLFAQKAASMPAGAMDESVTAAAPHELKDIVQAIFDRLAESLSGRPFVQAAVKALAAFVVNNLLDLVFDLLTTNGTRAAAGAVPMAYEPKNAESLCAELDAAVALG